MDAEHNLLFGILAAQLRGVAPAKIAMAGAAWLKEPETPVAERLVASGDISADHREIIEQLVRDAIRAHGGDPKRTLDEFGGGSIVSQTFDSRIQLDSDGEVSLASTKGREHESKSPGDSLPGMPEVPGRYTDLGEHGRGGFGRVLSVFDEHLSREVALKELVADREPGSARGSGSTLNPFRARFLQEARITSQLEHPSIVPVYEMGRRKNGNLYYTMKFVRGQTLQAAIDEAKTLEKRLKLLPHFVDLCQAIAYAHTRGILHRDIKPVNVMIGEFGETIALDWGLASKKDENSKWREASRETVRGLRLGEESEYTNTIAGEALGTPFYMPPEQALGNLEAIDERSDIYSLGIVLFEILTGRVPFEGESALAVLRQVVDKEPPAVASLERRVPPDLAAICHRAISKKAADRYQSAKQLAEDVGRFLSGAVVDAYNYSPVERFVRYTRKNWQAISTVSMAALVLLLTGLYSYTQILEERDVAIFNKKVADDARTRAEHLAYLNNVRFANAQLADGNLVQARETLSNAPDDFKGWEWGFLSRAASPFAYIIDPKDDSDFSAGTPDEAIYGASFSPDGRYLAVLQGWMIGIHDPVTGAVIERIHSGSSRLGGIAWSPSGNRLAKFELGGLVQVFKIGGGEEPLLSRSFTGTIRGVTFSPDENQLMVFGESRIGAQVLDVRTNAILQENRSHQTDIFDGAFLAQNGIVATSDVDGNLLFWDTETGTVTRTLKGSRFVIDRERRRILAAHRRNVILYDLDSPSSTASMVRLDADASRMVLSPDLSAVAITLKDRTVQLIALNESISVSPVRIRDATGACEFSHDGATLFTAGEIPRAWDTATGTLVAELRSNQRAARMVSAHPDKALLAVASAERGRPLNVWNDRYWLRENVPSGEPIMFDGSNDVIAIAGTLGLEIFNRRTKKIRFRAAQARLGQTGARTVHPDGAEAILATDPYYPLLIDCETGELSKNLSVLGAHLATSTYSPIGEQFAIAYSDDSIKVFSKGGDHVGTIRTNIGLVSSLAFNADGTRLLGVGTAGEIRVWNVDSAEPILERSIESQSTGFAAFGPDEDSVWVGIAGHGLAGYELASGAKIRHFETNHEIFDLSWNRDGSRMLTSTDAGMWIWNATTAEPLLSLSLGGSNIRHAKFNTYDNGVSAYFGSGFLRHWDADGNISQPPAPPIPIGSSAAVHLYAADTVIRQSISGLSDVKTHSDELNSGHIVLQGPALDAMKRLGFRQGDTITGIGGEKLGSETDASILLSRLRDRFPSPHIQIDFVRGGIAERCLLVPIPMVIREESRSVSAEEAIRLLSTKIELVAMNRDILEQGSRDKALALGDITEDSAELDGIVAMNMHFKGLDEELFEAFGINNGDRIREIDGIRMTSIDNFVDAMQTVVDRLRAGEELSTTYELDRGDFARITIRTKLAQPLGLDS